ncbi:hypothetical protein MMC21_002219 [Puttea exsequens]|nr:hypothetical protein [Puttea exsequens]
MAPPSPRIRRNGTTPKSSVTSASTASPPEPPSANSQIALLPTSLETLLLAIYPATLLLGSIFSIIDPTARNAPYNPVTQSHPPEVAPSYFAQKKNLFNVFFVKIAWFWVTLAFSLFLVLHPSTGPSRGLVLTPKRLRGFVRWGIITTWWALVTQWFFGPALIDRGFRITGGACELASTFEGTGGAREFVTGQACKSVGGLWKGGHDISGHVFILVLGSTFLGLEILPALVGARGLREERRITTRDGSVVMAERDISADDGQDADVKGGISAPLVVTGLSWWMLLMTATYFHTWFEKLTGLLVALAGIFVVYFLPRALPAMRDVIGMPGL